MSSVTPTAGCSAGVDACCCLFCGCRCLCVCLWRFIRSRHGRYVCEWWYFMMFCLLKLMFCMHACLLLSHVGLYVFLCCCLPCMFKVCTCFCFCLWER